MNGFVHRLERLRWGCLKAPVLFAQASGWLGCGKRWEFFGCGCHDCRHSELPFPAAGFRRRALFRKSPRASCPAFFDFLAANIAMSERSFFALNQPCGDLAKIGDLPTGLAVSHGPTLAEHTSLPARAGVAWADCPRFTLFRSVTNRTRDGEDIDGLGLKSGPIVLR